MSDIHEKIANLLELSRNNPSEEEAATALNMARRLMLKYNIDESELGNKSSVEYQQGSGVDRDYFRLLASGVSELVPARAILFGRGKNQEIKWAATKVNAQIADALLLFWADQIEALYKIHLPRSMSKSERARYRQDFKRNCAVGIIHRAREIKKQQILDEGEKGTALVVIEDKLMTEINDFLNTQNIKQGRGMKIRTHTPGAAHGRQAVGSVQMQRRVK